MFVCTLTLLVPNRARKVYGESCCEPAEKAWLIWKSGDIEKLLLSSARKPEKVWLVRNTSLCTSFEMLSTVPGLLSPRAALRSWKDLYVSRKTSKTPLVLGDGAMRVSGLVTSMGGMAIAGFSNAGAAMLGAECRGLCGL